MRNTVTSLITAFAALLLFIITACSPAGDTTAGSGDRMTGSSSDSTRNTGTSPESTPNSGSRETMAPDSTGTGRSTPGN